MEGVVVGGVDEGFEEGVGLVGGGFFGDEAEALGDAFDVGVDREGGAAEGEEEYAGDRLGADARECAEPCAGFFERHGFEEGEVPIRGAFADSAEDGLDAWGLLRREAAGLDGRDELIEGGVGDCVPRRIAAH